MRKIVYEESKPKLEKYEAIRCADCKTFLSGKRDCLKHLGHDVFYSDKEGNEIG